MMGRKEMDYLPTADECRAEVLNYRRDGIGAALTQAAKEGKGSLNILGKLRTEDKAELLAKGFQLSEGTFYTEVSWAVGVPE
jgi:hypothetical protein